MEESGFGTLCFVHQACGRFINNNSVTKAASSSSKSPELLARYCDLLLKKRFVKKPLLLKGCIVLSTSKEQNLIGCNEAFLTQGTLFTCPQFKEPGGGRVGRHVEPGDGRVQVHRGQGRLPEVLQQDARQAARAAYVCVGRRRGQHDLQTQGERGAQQRRRNALKFWTAHFSLSKKAKPKLSTEMKSKHFCSLETQPRLFPTFVGYSWTNLF